MTVHIRAPAAATAATVTVLMAVRDGGAALAAQLDSLAAQDHADWRLVASDDGSRDGSAATLRRFAAGPGAGRVTLAAGPRRGAAANFMAMLAGLPADAGWTAFSDQDDVWLPDRLSRGLAALAGGDAGRPALYCSRTWVVTDRLTGHRLSPPRPRPLSLRNALVQNVAAGNTILLNPAAAQLMRSAARTVPGVVMHDWWAYLLVAGAGGRLVHDDRPTLLYRQHGGNLVGANDGWGARARRLALVLRGDWRAWNDTNAAALAACDSLLTPAARALVAGWQAMRHARGAGERLSRAAALGLYRQSAAGDAALRAAVALGRV